MTRKDEQQPMAKISQIARFTTPVKLELPENTPVKKRTLPEILVKINEERHATKETLLEYIELVLIESDQPLTVIELAAKVSQDLGKRYDPNTIRLLVKELKEAGKVSFRIESTDERRIRANGKKVRNLVATLWWAPAGEVPQRTVTEAVPGVILTDESGRKQGTPNKLLRNTPPRFGEDTPALEGSPLSNPIVDYLVEKLVSERTAQLQEELARTKVELEDLKKLIRSALVDKI